MCFMEMEITTMELEAKLYEFNELQLRGLDNLHPRIVRKLTMNIRGPISSIFNKSMKLGLVSCN